MSNFPMFNVNMLPTPQLEQVLEALIDSAEINHWPANTDTLHWLAQWIANLQARDDGDDALAARTADLSNRLLKFYMAGQTKRKRKSRRKETKAPSSNSKTEALACLLDRPEGASRKEMCSLADWPSLNMRAIASRRPDKELYAWNGNDGLKRYRFVPKGQVKSPDFFEDDESGEGQDVFESEEEAA